MHPVSVSSIMAPRRQLLPLCHLFLLVLVAVAAFLCTTVPAVAAQEVYCRDSLAGLKECVSFMYGGAAAPSPSPACCAAYEAAFDADPFCLCYVADGTYGRATGYDVDVAHGLQIPARCGQAQPPVELCNMEGLVLPPYAPQGTPPAAHQPPAAAADAPNAQPPSASRTGSPSLPVAPPTFTSPPPPSSGAPDLRPELVILVAAAILLL